MPKSKLLLFFLCKCKPEAQLSQYSCVALCTSYLELYAGVAASQMPNVNYIFYSNTFRTSLNEGRRASLFFTQSCTICPLVADRQQTGYATPTVSLFGGETAN